MRVDGNQSGRLEPNNSGRWAERPATPIPHGRRITADHFDFREDDDNYFEQPGNLTMTGDEQQRLFEAPRAPSRAPDATVEKHIANNHADPAAAKVRKM
jgi:catalase